MMTLSGLFPVSQADGRATNPKQSTSTSFAEQLAGALSSILESSSSDSHIEIDTVRERGEAVIRITQPAPAVAPAASRANTAIETPGVSGTTASGNTAVPKAAYPPVDAVDAYWGQFPPEVQSLRTIKDPDTRADAAARLAGQGHTIDYLTMVWGWHPLQAMKIRRETGYSWIPAMGQPQVQTPGVHFPGIPDYDPGAHPEGSIKVSLDFAKGCFIDPLYFSDAEALAQELGGVTSRDSTA